MSVPAHASVSVLRAARSRRPADDSRRVQLLDQLEQIFLADGFSGVTIDELCRRLHCSKRTLYAVAATREQLIQAVTRHFFARSTATIEAELAKESDPAQRIITYLAGVGKAMRRNSSAYYVDMVSYQPTAEIYRLNSDAAARRVRGLIEDGVKSGVFRSADAALAAQTVALLIDGVYSGEVLKATGLSAGEAFTELGELLVHGLSVRDDASRG